MTKPPKVAVGQRWRSKDPREQRRTVFVESVDDDEAVIRVLTAAEEDGRIGHRRKVRTASFPRSYTYAPAQTVAERAEMATALLATQDDPAVAAVAQLIPALAAAIAEGTLTERVRSLKDTGRSASEWTQSLSATKQVLEVLAEHTALNIGQDGPNTLITAIAVATQAEPGHPAPSTSASTN